MSFGSDLPFRTTISARDETGRAVRSAQGNFSSLSQKVTALSTAYLAVTDAAGKLFRIGEQIIGQQIQQGRHLLDYTQRIDISVESLDALTFANEKFGVSASTTEMAIQRMNRRIGEVAQFGRGEAKDAIEDLGLVISDLSQMRADEQFEAIAAALVQVEDGSRQTALAAKLFDAEGVSLLQTINALGGSFSGAREELEALGIWTEEQAKRSAEAAKQAHKLARAWQNVKRAIADELLTSVTDRDIERLTRLFATLAGVAGTTTQVVIRTVDIATGGAGRRFGAEQADRVLAAMGLDPRETDALLAGRTLPPTKHMPPEFERPLGGQSTMQRLFADAMSGMSAFTAGFGGTRARASDQARSAAMARFQRLQELGIPTIGGVDTTEPVIEMMEEIRGTAPEMEAITEKVKELPIDVDKYRTAAEAALVRQKELTKELAATFGAFVIDSTIEGADRLGRELGNALFTARKGVDVLKAAFQDLVRTIVGDLLAVGARGVTGGLIGGITRIFGGGGGGGFDWADFWNDQQFRGGGNVTNLNFSINASSRAAGFEAGRGILQALNEAGYVR